MERLDRITQQPDVMGGKACIRGVRVTVGTVIWLLAAGRSREEILKAYRTSNRRILTRRLSGPFFPFLLPTTSFSASGLE